MYNEKLKRRETGESQLLLILGADSFQDQWLFFFFLHSIIRFKWMTLGVRHGMDFLADTFV